MFPQIAQSQCRQHHLRRHTLLSRFRRQSRQLIAGFLLIGLGQNVLDIPKQICFSR